MKLRSLHISKILYSRYYASFFGSHSIVIFPNRQCFCTVYVDPLHSTREKSGLCGIKNFL